MITKTKGSPLPSKTYNSTAQTRLQHKTMTSLRNLPVQADRAPKKLQPSFNSKTFHMVKPSIENLISGNSFRTTSKGPKMNETSGFTKPNISSLKKADRQCMNYPPKTSNNIYSKYGNRQVDSYLKHVTSNKPNKNSNQVFKELCSTRTEANTLKTALSNDFFMLKKHIETEKRQIVDFLDTVINIAEGLKKNVVKTYDSEFNETFKFYTSQINRLGEQRAVLDDQISSFNDIALSTNDFLNLMVDLKLLNQLCKFPFESQDLRDKARDQVITLLQEVASPVPVKKTISAIDDYNEHVMELRNRFNISQTSTIPKKNTNSHVHRDLGQFFDANKTQSDDRELSLTIVKDILSKNDQVLNKLAEFSLDELNDETESQIVDDELKNSLSSVQLKCSEELCDNDDSKILLINN